MYKGFNYMSEPFAKEYLNCKLLRSDYDDVIKLLDNSPFSLNDKPLYLGVSYCLTDRIEQAESILLPKENSDRSYDLLLYSIRNYKSGKTKSPALALAFSSIVPGSGKFYTGDWKDGLIALSFVSLSAWQSYRGFKKNGVESLYGWLYGVASVSFYIGNLYGSVKSANMYNMRRQESFESNVQDIFMHTLE